MRPKKVILLVADDEQRLAQRRFLLETRGYRVLAAAPGQPGALFTFQGRGIFTESQRAALCRLDGIDLVVFLQLQDDALASSGARAMKALRAETPVLILSLSAYHDPTTAADCFLSNLQGSPMELLERVRIFVARKRGPKKRPVANVVPAAEMAVAHG